MFPRAWRTTLSLTVDSCNLFILSCINPAIGLQVTCKKVVLWGYVSCTQAGLHKKLTLTLELLKSLGSFLSYQSYLGNSNHKINTFFSTMCRDEICLCFKKPGRVISTINKHSPTAGATLNLDRNTQLYKMYES